ncbi:MAG: LicD family protein [Bacteroidales bacterium]|nr:LicD family protein [Bacteroidales bacterium]
MANYDIELLHRRILDILLAFGKVCQEHGLRYCICGGTMIGAVRHKGFIPWDDDLDVSMPRPDYERLIAHSAEWLPEPYEFVCAENDPDYPLPFGKIQDASTTLIERPHLFYLGGCYIDIFPFDAYPDSFIKRKWQRARYQYLKKVLYFVHRDPYRHGHGPASWLPLLARRFYTLSGVQRRIRKVMTAYDYDKCHYAASYTDGYKKILPKETMDTYVPYEFEGHTVQGIKDYDRYLSAMYGDYMTLPPVEDRWQHNFYLLDFNTPYREWRGKDSSDAANPVSR